MGHEEGRRYWLLGKEALKRSNGNRYVFSSAPKPHELFEEYILLIPPDRGLIKIIAVSQTIRTSVFGDEIRSKFSDIEAAVNKAYGEGQRFDFLRSGSIWNEPQDWMMGLLKEERSLETFWTLEKSAHHVTAISLTARALSREAGFISLAYEFEGFADYVEEMKKKKESVF